MRIQDIKQVGEIERLSFPIPWSRDDFREIVLSKVYKPYVAKSSDDEVMGYVVFYTAGDEGHIMNIVTHPNSRRQGIAKQLLGFAHKIFKKEGAMVAYLELRRSNYSAYRLYKKYGYVYVGIRKDYYPDNMEDAILMRKSL